MGRATAGDSALLGIQEGCGGECLPAGRLLGGVGSSAHPHRVPHGTGLGRRREGGRQGERAWQPNVPAPAAYCPFAFLSHRLRAVAVSLCACRTSAGAAASVAACTPQQPSSGKGAATNNSAATGTAGLAGALPAQASAPRPRSTPGLCGALPGELPHGQQGRGPVAAEAANFAIASDSDEDEDEDEVG